MKSLRLKAEVLHMLDIFSEHLIIIQAFDFGGALQS